MKNKVLDTINRHKMIMRGERIVVGVSGGADSTALLHLLNSLKSDLDITLVSAHLNHKLRGEESEKDQEFVRNFSKSLGVEFICKSVEIESLSLLQNKSIEQTARDERYAFFYEIPQADKIATAHSLNDSAETMLFNLTRGSGIDGLRGIPPVRDNIIRPLIECTRQEIEAYCKSNHLAYCTDSTNAQNIYNRNKIRNMVFPVLNEINSNLLNNLQNTQQILAKDSEYLSKTAFMQKEKLIYNKKYLRKEFLELDYAISSRVLMLIFKENQIEINHERIKNAYNDIFSTKSGLQFSENNTLHVENDYFFVGKVDNPSDYFEKQLNVEQLIGEHDLFFCKKVVVSTIECKEFENIEKFSPKRLKNIADCDKIASSVKFRQRLPGDKLQPLQRRLTKSLKQLFNESKLSLKHRSEVVVFEHNGKVGWVEDVGIDLSLAPDKGTENYIEFIVKK